MDTKRATTHDILRDAAASMDKNSVAAEAVFIPLDKVAPNPFQPRRTFDQAALNGLAETIKADGVRSPITVRQTRDPEASHLFEIVAGERRVRAARLAGLTEIPAFIKDYDDKEMRREGLLENIQREDLNFVDTVFGYVELRQDYETAEGVAKQVGKDKSTVAKYFKLHEAITSIPEVSALFLNQASEVDRSTAEGYTKIAGELKKISKANRREYDRIIRRFGREGLKESIPGLLFKFLNKKGNGDSDDPGMVRESAKDIIFRIRIKKGEAVAEDTLAAIDAGFSAFRQKVAEIGAKEK